MNNSFITNIINNILNYLNIKHNNLSVIGFTEKKFNKNRGIYGKVMPSILNNMDNILITINYYTDNKPGEIWYISEYNENNHVLLLNISNQIPETELIHTIAHELIHYMQYNLEFKTRIPNHLHHNSIIWNMYSKKLGLMTQNNNTFILPNGYVSQLILEIKNVRV